VKAADGSPRPGVVAAVAMLRARGERVTRAREAVLDVLDGVSEHLTADEIVLRAAARAPGVHRATVYRALATLRDLDVVAHTHVGGSAAVYHLSLPGASDERSGPHAHLQCTTCGVVLDLPAAELQPLAARLRGALGFRLEPAHAALLGTCAACAATGTGGG